MLPLYDIVAQPLYLFILNNPYNTARAGQEKCVHPPVRFLFAEQCGSFIAAQKCIKSTTTTTTKIYSWRSKYRSLAMSYVSSNSFQTHIPNMTVWRIRGILRWRVTNTRTHTNRYTHSGAIISFEILMCSMESALHIFAFVVVSAHSRRAQNKQTKNSHSTCHWRAR